MLYGFESPQSIKLCLIASLALKLVNAFWEARNASVACINALRYCVRVVDGMASVRFV